MKQNPLQWKKFQNVLLKEFSGYFVEIFFENFIFFHNFLLEALPIFSRILEKNFDFSLKKVPEKQAIISKCFQIILERIGENILEKKSD